MSWYQTLLQELRLSRIMLLFRWHKPVSAHPTRDTGRWKSALFSPPRASTLASACSSCLSTRFSESSRPMSGYTLAVGSPGRMNGSEGLLSWRDLSRRPAGSWKPCSVLRKRSWLLLGWMLLFSIEFLCLGMVYKTFVSPPCLLCPETCTCV